MCPLIVSTYLTRRALRPASSKIFSASSLSASIVLTCKTPVMQAIFQLICFGFAISSVDGNRGFETPFRAPKSFHLIPHVNNAAFCCKQWRSLLIYLLVKNANKWVRSLKDYAKTIVNCKL
jgi:hypothetical protein